MTEPNNARGGVHKNNATNGTPRAKYYKNSLEDRGKIIIFEVYTMEYSSQMREAKCRINKTMEGYMAQELCVSWRALSGTS